MEKSNHLKYQSCGDTVTITHIFNEWDNSKNHREELKIIHSIGKILGSYQNNKMNTIKYFRQIENQY